MTVIMLVTKRDFQHEMSNHEGPFATAPAVAPGAKNLVSVAMGAASHAGGEYGASEVVEVQEVSP